VTAELADNIWQTVSSRVNFINRTRKHYGIHFR